MPQALLIMIAMATLRRQSHFDACKFVTDSYVQGLDYALGVCPSPFLFLPQTPELFRYTADCTLHIYTTWPPSMILCTAYLENTQNPNMISWITAICTNSDLLKG